jgi:MYXO-CTERM domain-containing protein
MTALAGAVLLAAPQSAEACGGFFCDGGPQPMPVDQTGEDILFVMDEGQVEVHIRVEYEGEAENFAWIIPALSVPTDFNVSSQTLFDAIKGATVPTYGITNTADNCSMDDDFPNGDTAGAGGTSGADPSGAGDTDGGGGPVVLAEEQVGAYEITVIGAGEGGDVTAQEVFDWLAENDYQQDEAALPIIEEYLQENHNFIAIRLTGGADVDELHPIALRFDHPEPCVPLRLTRIAAVDDMDVRTYFLADDRVVPDTYRHVLVNALKIDWPNQASNYKEVITRAVDADGADGRAFVTEYAGASDVVPTFSLHSPSWNAQAFEGLAPEDAINTLANQGLFFCDYDWNLDQDVCFSPHPLVEPLLVEFLVPEGVDVRDFYRDPYAYSDVIDVERWGNGTVFAERLQERVIEPGANAVEILASHDYLTRMYTTISPSEMTADPMFFANPDLEEVPNIRTGTNRTLCNGDNLWTLPDGREVYVPAGDSWPNIGGDDYWEEEVQEMSTAGAPMSLVQNTAQIDEALAAYNADAGWDGVPPEPGTNVGGQDDTEASGCGCTTADATEGALWSSVFLFGLLGLRRRRD